MISHSYHNLFKQFLVKKLHELKSENEIKKLPEKYSGTMNKKGANIPAIEFCLYSENYDKAVEMIISSFDEIFQSGRYELLDKWLKSLPATITNNNSFILLFRQDYFIILNLMSKRHIVC
jgi:LuxR family maltose regulon positive regulatory protein